MLHDDQQAPWEESLRTLINLSITPSLISKIKSKCTMLGARSISIDKTTNGELQITYSDSNGQKLLVQILHTSLENVRQTPLIKDDGRDFI